MLDVYNIAWLVLFINLLLIIDDLRFLVIILLLSNINIYNSIALNIIWCIIITIFTVFIPLCNWKKYINEYNIYIKKNILLTLLFILLCISYMIYDYHNSSIFYSIMIYPFMCAVLNIYFFIIVEREMFMTLNIIINIFVNIGLFQIIYGFIYN
jgi:hypothetical protein